MVLELKSEDLAKYLLEVSESQYLLEYYDTNNDDFRPRGWGKKTKPRVGFSKPRLEIGTEVSFSPNTVVGILLFRSRLKERVSVNFQIYGMRNLENQVRKRSETPDCRMGDD
jgi:hypothetical protein